MSKVVEESVVKNMAFLIKMLENEWEVSKESVKTISISMKEVSQMKSELSRMIQVNTGVFESNCDEMNFKECMMMNKENHTLLRITKKIVAAIEKAQKEEAKDFAITLDKEEVKLYKELFNKNS